MESTFLRPLPFFLYGHSRRVALTVQQRAAHSFFVQGGKSRAATGVFILFTVRLAKVEHTTAQPPLSPPAKLHLFYQHIQTIQKRHLINSKLFRVTWLCVCVCEQFAFVCVSVISSVFQRVSLPPNNTILLFSFSPAGKETKHKRFQWWDFFKIFFVQVPKRKKRKKRVCLCVSVCCTLVCAHAVPCVCMRRCVPDFKNRIFFFFLHSFFLLKKKITFFFFSPVWQFLSLFFT